MKGLLIKDFLNLKKQGVMIGAITLFYLFFTIATKSISMFGPMVIMLFAMLPITAISYDERANWNKYGLTMPVSRVDLVLSKYILALILSIIALALNFVAQFFLDTSLSKDDIISIFIIFSISILFISLLLPIIFKFGSEKARLLMIVIFLLPTLIIVMFSSSLKSFDEEIITKTLYALPVAAVVAFILSIIVSVSIYKKKEF